MLARSAAHALATHRSTKPSTMRRSSLQLKETNELVFQTGNCVCAARCVATIWERPRTGSILQVSENGIWVCSVKFRARRPARGGSPAGEHGNKRFRIRAAGIPRGSLRPRMLEYGSLYRSMSHRVLIITYLFPPSGGIGPPRYVGYTRHLPAHGCEVSVIAPKNPHPPLYDPALLQQVPPETRVHRVFSPTVPYFLRDRVWKNISGSAGRPPGAPGADSGLIHAGKKLVKEAVQRFFNPDVQKFWVPFVLRRARRVIREEGIQTVILNIPPFSLFALVPPLKREFPRLKWITEIRDDWLGYYLQFFDSAKTDAKRRLAIRLEGDAMRASDFVVAVTPAQRDAIDRKSTRL